ncbi:hypothetical protein [Thiohalomonas denitrificans]|uniref:hypothetical protein n=1 Tax=Thiohalomonas denitrificans TaxID=415747 RepID=UPI0026EE1115|nr:hypothetical protein [Thiohalomonas denitrificans]
MAFELKEFVPWGRSFQEYVDMFALAEEELGKAVLGCGDGPASFNAELTKRGGRFVSVDPLYAFGADAISGLPCWRLYHAGDCRAFRNALFDSQPGGALV